MEYQIASHARAKSGESLSYKDGVQRAGNPPGTPLLTEGNVNRLFGKNTRSPSAAYEGAYNHGAVGRAGEIGAAERVKRYIQAGQANRAAREAHLALFTRDMLQSL